MENIFVPQVTKKCQNHKENNNNNPGNILDCGFEKFEQSRILRLSVLCITETLTKKLRGFHVRFYVTINLFKGI